MLRRIPWQDVYKFLAGAFFANAGILFYLYLERVMNFLTNKAVLCIEYQALSLGWHIKHEALEPITQAMSAMRNGRFALRI